MVRALTALFGGRDDPAGYGGAGGVDPTPDDPAGRLAGALPAPLTAPDVASSTPSRLAPFTVEPDLLAIWPLTRDGVWQVPAVAQGLQVIAGTIGTLPIARYRGREPLDVGTLLAQPDPEEPREATLTRLVEDLVLFPVAYLVVLERGADGFPLHARFYPNELVEPVDPPRDISDPVGFGVPRQYRIGVGSGVTVDARDVLRFPAHWPGLLTVGARSLTTAALLEQAAQRFARIDLPAGELHNEGADLPPAKVSELLDTWERARQTHGVGYTNALINFRALSWDAAQLQLVEARRFVTSEIARMLNLPSRYVNAPAESSMTYANVESERRDLVDLSLRPYLAAVERRLSMDDVCPHGTRAVFDLDAFYRGDLSTRGAYYTQALNGPTPWMIRDEVRAREGLPQLPEDRTSADTTPPTV